MARRARGRARARACVALALALALALARPVEGGRARTARTTTRGVVVVARALTTLVTTTTTRASARERWNDDDDDEGDDGFDGLFDDDVFANDADDGERDDDGMTTVETGTSMETALRGDVAAEADEDVDEGSAMVFSEALSDDGGEETSKGSVLADLVALGGTEARALMRDLFVEASKFGLDVDGEDEDDVDDDGGSSSGEGVEDVSTDAMAPMVEDEDALTELRALEYDENEDDSEDERAIEQRKKLLIELGVDIEAVPAPTAVEPEAVKTEPEPVKVEPMATAPSAALSKPPDVRLEEALKAIPNVLTAPKTRRTLLSVIDASNVRWLTWDDMPEGLRRKVSGSVPMEPSPNGRVVRVGGYWRAAGMNNMQRRKSKSRNGFPLRKYEVEEEVQECNKRYVVSAVECFGENSRQAVITVDGSHSFLPGDYITFDRVGAANPEHSLEINRQHRVYGLPADLNVDASRLSWTDVWSSSPLVGNHQSAFAVTFNTPGVACDAIPIASSIVRSSANTRLPFC
ncbi:unnamed product [Ostreococcus tauri]|uniref:Unnamed product n=1 Tax=Ostreococcus tauri TaxID=70448 RepID=A0A090N472_OSTTA|nr:unnamed product [Ostreococcus tauri]CEF99363.1 unnamed product [Ostreococcus tauri]|eukprot:XP_003081598.2 unnamed product [Ostreococcus tauri]